MQEKPIVDLIRAAILAAEHEQLPFVVYLLEMALIAAATDTR